MTSYRFGTWCLVWCIATALAATSHAATIIVNDSFTSEDRSDEPGDPLDAGWWSTTSSSGNSIEIDSNGLGLRSGTSGRGIRGIFPEQTLAVGDTITATYTFVTPATVGVDQSTDFRIGLYNSEVDPVNGTSADLEADLAASSSNPNPLYEDIGGYMADYDVGFTAVPDDANISIRERVTQPAFAQSGRLMSTTGSYDSLGGGTDIGDGYAFDQANTEYVGVLSVTRTAAGIVEIFSSLSTGGSLVNSYSVVDDAADGAQHPGVTTSFSQLGFHAGTNAFGSTNSADDPDNGITFTNVTIEVTRIPEPASMTLMLGTLAGLLIRGRRS